MISGLRLKNHKRDQQTEKLGKGILEEKNSISEGTDGRTSL